MCTMRENIIMKVFIYTVQYQDGGSIDIHMVNNPRTELMSTVYCVFIKVAAFSYHKSCFDNDEPTIL